MNKENCPFCNLSNERIIAQTEQFYIIKDRFPVTPDHRLIIPKRHAETWFDLSLEEQTEINQILVLQKEELLMSDTNISGFNIGINSGESAGQTIYHCHIHLIPRRKGDCTDPRGGVRGVIPEKQRY